MAVASRKSRLLVFVVLCLLVPTGCLSSRLNFDKHVALFVFGDSLFDPGNNNYIDTITEYQANYWPYGISYFHPPSGRNNDGRVIPDFIAEYARLPLIPAYLNPENNEFTHGANFASGGSGALIETKAGFVIDLHTQVRYFGNLENRYRQNLGYNKARKLISNAVYLFSSGINDYLDLTDPDAYDQHVGIVIGNLTNAIKAIYDKGGRKFGFMTVPLIGCFPTMRVEQPGNTCSKEIDVIMRLHNQAFAKKLEILETQLEGFIYAKFDFATSFDKIMKNPSKYGFKEGATACCGSGPFRGEYSCGGMRGIKEYELCENATEYLFFDCGHPSELASRQLAELFWKGDSKVTAPYNLKTFFEGKGSLHASSQMYDEGSYEAI